MSALAAPVIAIDHKQSLFEIRDYIECLFESIDGLEDPALRAEAEAELDKYLQLEVRKVDRISEYLAHLEAQQAAAAVEIKRLQDRKRDAERTQERVEASVQRVMQLWGMNSLNGKTNTIQLRSCPPSIEVLDQSIVPQEYISVKVTESVDKTAAKKALQAGELIEGLRLVTDKQTVVRR